MVGAPDLALGGDLGAGRTKASHNTANPRRVTTAERKTNMRRSNMRLLAAQWEPLGAITRRTGWPFTFASGR